MNQGIFLTQAAVLSNCGRCLVNKSRVFRSLVLWLDLLGVATWKVERGDWSSEVGLREDPLGHAR
jgi:hypothetical protein